MHVCARALPVVGLARARSRIVKLTSSRFLPRCDGGQGLLARPVPTVATMSLAAQRPAKVHKSAICIIPPEDLWGPVQVIREKHDKNYARWMPHINLLYPFWEDRGGNFQLAAAKAVEALSGMEPIKLILGDFKYFEHAKSCTAWLDPGEALTELAALQAALEKAFPECNDVSSVISDSFVPHLSVGQWPHVKGVRQAVESFSASWQPLRFTVDHVYLISRADFHDPFHVRCAIPLGASPGSLPPLVEDKAVPVFQESLVRVPPATCREASQEPEVAAAQDSSGMPSVSDGVDDTNGTVWNFAYGANMNRHKLEVVRGIRPIKSLPALLPGHRLAFTHRGGFGTVESAPGSSVHGVLHCLTAQQFAKLAATESEYEQRQLSVSPYDGSGPVMATVFWTPETKRIAFGLPPTSRYLNLLRSGATTWHLDRGLVSIHFSLDSRLKT